MCLTLALCHQNLPNSFGFMTQLKFTPFHFPPKGAFGFFERIKKHTFSLQGAVLDTHRDAVFWLPSVTLFYAPFKNEIEILLAHWWAYSKAMVCRPSVVRPPFSKIFFSKTAGPIKAKFHMEPQWDGGTKVYSRGLGHMTKMAATPIYGKNLQKSSPEPKGQRPCGLVCSIGALGPS